jgi:hypothetical protein
VSEQRDETKKKKTKKKKKKPTQNEPSTETVSKNMIDWSPGASSVKVMAGSAILTPAPQGEAAVCKKVDQKPWYECRE